MFFFVYFQRGFPFDEPEDRGLRARLAQRHTDFAERHPEFAEHFSSPDWLRRHFDDHSYPFEDFDEPHFARTRRAGSSAHQQQSAPQAHKPQQPSGQPQAPPQPQPKTTPIVTKPPATPESGKKIQQSNTVDLGQPQATLVDDTRNIRSMSAPPQHPNRAGGQRFISSVNIPNVNADMGSTSSQPAQQGTASPAAEPAHSNPKEHYIPIHVEGRDEVLTPTATAQTQHPQRTHNYTQYVNPPPDQDAKVRQENLRRRQEEIRRQEWLQQQQQHEQQQQQQQEAEVPQPPRQPPPVKTKPTSEELIQNIQKDVSELLTEVTNFDGKPRDKRYLYLDEMLTRKMILLDDIETGGQDSIRNARRETIRRIQETIRILETKAQANEDAAAKQTKEATPTPEMALAVQNPAANPEPTPSPAPADAGAPDAAPPTAEETASADVPSVEHSTDNQELIVGGVARSGSQITAMDVDDAEHEPAEPSVETPPVQDEPKSDDVQEGGNEKKRAKKKADKK